MFWENHLFVKWRHFKAIHQCPINNNLKPILRYSIKFNCNLRHISFHRVIFCTLFNNFFNKLRVLKKYIFELPQIYKINKSPVALTSWTAWIIIWSPWITWICVGSYWGRRIRCSALTSWKFSTLPFSFFLCCRFEQTLLWRFNCGCAANPLLHIGQKHLNSPLCFVSMCWFK